MLHQGAETAALTWCGGRGKIPVAQEQDRFQGVRVNNTSLLSHRARRWLLLHYNHKTEKCKGPKYSPPAYGAKCVCAESANNCIHFNHRNSEILNFPRDGTLNLKSYQLSKAMGLHSIFKSCETNTTRKRGAPLLLQKDTLHLSASTL